ncbi:hypothetical protein CEXT_589701 [Caerostris extrusa]|uniref:Uncharacterized protein n=1 Tax=Caerostris extrusa TaxID=172846 RepID=A0AAV4T8P6_CAEEX|nr:hypothetical protein CEXT_589701 [Caerostris extrusa]
MNSRDHETPGRREEMNKRRKERRKERKKKTQKRGTLKKKSSIAQQLHHYLGQEVNYEVVTPKAMETYFPLKDSIYRFHVLTARLGHGVPKVYLY